MELTMKIITSSNVDLISPFPATETKRAFGWSRSFYTFSENDDTPKTAEEFEKYIKLILAVCPSYGIIDKNAVTNPRIAAPLVGVILFEPAGLRQAYIHIATARRAFKMGLIDEAVEVARDEMFSNNPDLLRLGLYLDEQKGPVKYLMKRAGWLFEGVVRDAILRDGQPKNLIYCGLTRTDWENRNQEPVVVEEEEVVEQIPEQVEVTTEAA